jgi:hypothetical protein
MHSIEPNLSLEDPTSRSKSACHQVVADALVAFVARGTRRSCSPSNEYVEGQECGHQHVRHIHSLGDAEIHCNAA